METFTEPKKLVTNPLYQEQRNKILSNLVDDMIDAPIINIIKEFNKLSFCFTLQGCYGHFVYNGQKDILNFEPLPSKDTISIVEYRIAYIAFCVEHSTLGRELLESLKGITTINQENIQFCSAEWFWKRQVNSYVLQVEPSRFKRKDTVILEFKEALNLEKIRNEFFIQIDKLLSNFMEIKVG